MNTMRDDDQILKDGQRLSVRIFAMDAIQRDVAARKPSAVGHKPGSLPVTDSDRQRRRALYDAADHKLSDRWKNPPSVKSEPVTTADRYAARDKKLSDRWRS